MVSDNFLALDVGSTHIDIAVGDREDVLVSDRVRREEHWSEDGLVSLIEEFLATSEFSVGDMAAIGMGVPGLIDKVEKRIVKANQIEEMGVRKVEDRLDVPLYLENDANVAVLGERVYGAGQGVSNVVTVIMGTGIGGGVIYDGQLLGSGSDGRSPEPGFVPVAGGAAWHGCCAGGTIPGFVEGMLEEEDRDTRLEEGMAAEEIFALRGEDEAADEYIGRLATISARGMASVVNCFAPQVLTVAGSVALENPAFMEEVFDRAEGMIVNPVPDMLLSPLGKEAGLYGALALAVRRREG